MKTLKSRNRTSTPTNKQISIKLDIAKYESIQFLKISAVYLKNVGIDLAPKPIDEKSDRQSDGRIDRRTDI